MFPNHFAGKWGPCGWKTRLKSGPDRISEILVTSFLPLPSSHRWPGAAGWDISSPHLKVQRCYSSGVCALQFVASGWLAFPAEQRLRLKAECKPSYQHMPPSVYSNREEIATCKVSLSRGDKNKEQKDYLAVHMLFLLQGSPKLA